MPIVSDEEFEKMYGGVATTPQAKTVLSDEDFAKQYGASAAHGAGGSWDEEPQPPTLAQRALAGVEKVGAVGGPLAFLNPVGQTMGMAKGVVSTAHNLTDMVSRATGQGSYRPEMESALETKNPAEWMGKAGEQVAEFVTGAGAAAKLPGMAKLATKVPKIAGAVSQAISGAGVTKAQGGTNEEAGVNAALGVALPALFEGTAKFMKGLGAKMQMSLMRPTSADMAAGFKPENVDVYGVSRATLPRALKAVNEKITKLATDLRNITKGSDASVDLNQALLDTEQELLSRAGRLKSPGDSAAIKGAIERFREDAAALGGSATVDEAQTLKRAVGLKGAWAYGKTDADKAAEAVANAYYSKLKGAIEAVTPPELVAINKQLGELMPIEQAIVRRIPVAMRNSPLSLSDLVLLAHGHPIGALVHIASKTGVMAGVPASIGTGMRTATRPLTATIQEINTSKRKQEPQKPE